MSSRPAKISPHDIPDDAQACFSWPQSMLEMADWIGAVATLRLVAAFGGRDLYVPTVMPEDHPIVAAVGIDAALRLARVYGCERVELPVGRAALARAVRPA